MNVEDKSHTFLSYDLAMKFGNHYKDVVGQKWLSLLLDDYYSKKPKKPKNLSYNHCGRRET